MTIRTADFDEGIIDVDQQDRQYGGATFQSQEDDSVVDVDIDNEALGQHDNTPIQPTEQDDDICGLSALAQCVVLTILTTLAALILPSIALHMAHDNNNNNELALPNDACDDAAHWMTVLAWFQIVFILYVAGFTLWKLRQVSLFLEGWDESVTRADVWTMDNLPISKTGLLVLSAMTTMGMVFQLAWLLYGALYILAGNWSDFAGGEPLETSCQGMADFALLYCLLGLAVMLAQCWAHRKASEQQTQK